MEKIVLRNHEVKAKVFGLQRQFITTYPDTYTGNIFRKFTKSQVWFTCLWDFLDNNLTKFLEWVFEGIRRALQVVLAIVFFVFSVLLLLIFTLAPQAILRAYWRLRGYKHRENTHEVYRRNSLDFQLVLDKGELVIIAEIRELLGKVSSASAEVNTLSDLAVLDKACGVAEDCLLTGESSAELTQDLRKLLRLVDNLGIQ